MAMGCRNVLVGVLLTHKPRSPSPLCLVACGGAGCVLCPGTDAHSPARSLGKVLMTLITGLVCAINVYFVVDFLPTLQGLGYYIPLGLLLAAYVAFVAYLVRLALWGGAVGGGRHPWWVPINLPALPPQIWTCSIAHGAWFLARGHHSRFNFGISFDPAAVAGTR